MREKIPYLEISYPNFTLGQIIDPDEANQNNYEIVTKINEFVDDVEEALDIADDASLNADIALNTSVEALGKSNTAVSTSEEAIGKANTAELNSSTALDKATQVEGDYRELEPDLFNAVDEVNWAMSGGFDNRYVTRSEVDFQNNIDFIYEVFVIVSSDNGDGTFSYKNEYDQIITGEIINGYQVFNLEKGDYTLDENRISAYINDTLHRSKASGGLLEVDSNRVGISMEQDGAEITIQYFTITGSLGSGIVVGFVEPPTSYPGKIWIDTSDIQG